MLELQHLTKSYRNRPVVDDVNFMVKPGEITGYLGPNGSGKSTTVKMITGLIEPSLGKVLYGGADVRDDLAGFRQQLGYVPEEAILYSYMSGIEYLEMIGRLRGMSEALVQRRANALLELFSLHPHRHSPISSYSKGMKQRVLISSALIHDPVLLILDEPLSGMDVSSAALFKHLLEELAGRGKAVLYISHVLEVVEKVCGRVIILYKGRLMADASVDELRANMNLPSLERIFAELVEQRDLRTVARDIAGAIAS